MGGDKFKLAALVHRLIYGSDTTFSHADARELCEMIPPEGRRGRFGDWFQVSAKVRVSGGSASGAAAGVGNVSAPAKARGVPVMRFPADWNNFGRSAGPRRNLQMAEYAEALIAFPGGKGTANMVVQATERGRKVLDWRRGEVE